MEIADVNFEGESAVLLLSAVVQQQVTIQLDDDSNPFGSLLLAILLDGLNQVQQIVQMVLIFFKVTVDLNDFRSLSQYSLCYHLFELFLVLWYF